MSKLLDIQARENRRLSDELRQTRRHLARMVAIFRHALRMRPFSRTPHYRKVWLAAYELLSKTSTKPGGDESC